MSLFVSRVVTSCVISGMLLCLTGCYKSLDVSKPIKQAPRFEVTTLSGQSLWLYPQNNKPTFLNFWVSWCKPCLGELPIIQQAYEKYKDKVNFYLVNQSRHDELSSVRALIQDQGYTVPVVLDAKSEGARYYQVVSLPVSVFISKTGELMTKKLGALHPKELDDLLSRLVAF